MNIAYPLLAILGESFGKTVDKLNFNKNRIAPNQLIFLLFSTMVAGLSVALVFAEVPFPSIPAGIGILIAAMIAISSASNFFDFKGLSTTNLSVRQPIANFQPILASFLAYLIFPSERDPKYILAIVAGSAILYLINSDRRLKLKVDRGVIYLTLAMVCSAVLQSVYKLGLESVAPMYLLLFRAAGVLVFSILFLKLNLPSLNKKQVGYGVGAGLLYLLGNLGELYSIHSLGLNATILILLLGPALVYLLCALVLREKVLFRQVAGSAALLLIVILVVYL